VEVAHHELSIFMECVPTTLKLALQPITRGPDDTTPSSS
jgi:hypothetical protein